MELTGIAQGGSASSGARRSGRIRRRRSSAAGEGENVGGGVPGLFWSRETTRRTREDLRSSGRRRGGERSTVDAAIGVRGGGGSRVRGREAGRCVAPPEKARASRGSGKQEVAEARVRARRPHALLPTGRRWKMTGRSPGGLGLPARPPGRFGPGGLTGNFLLSLCLLFSVVFFFYLILLPLF